MLKRKYLQERNYCIVCLKEITGKQGSHKYCRECGQKIAKNMTLIYLRKKRRPKVEKIYTYGKKYEESRNEENS